MMIAVHPDLRVSIILPALARALARLVEHLLGGNGRVHGLVELRLQAACVLSTPGTVRCHDVAKHMYSRRRYFANLGIMM